MYFDHVCSRIVKSIVALQSGSIYQRRGCLSRNDVASSRMLALHHHENRMHTTIVGVSVLWIDNDRFENYDNQLQMRGLSWECVTVILFQR